MMQAFRNVAKPVIIVISVAFLLWLVWDLSGLGSGGSGLFATTTVGKVNGRSVDVRAFDQRVQNVISERQQRGASLGLDEIQEIRDGVWNQVVQEYLLQGEYRRLGLRVSDDEVVDAIKNVPPPEVQQAATFQTNGQFDIDKYQRWLRSAEGQALVPGLEYQYRAQLLQAKLFRSVVADVFISDAMLWERYRDENEKVKVGLVRIDPATTVTDQSAPVTAEEAEAYYNQHREEFRRKRAAFLSYVVVPRVAIASDSAAALARIKALKEEIQTGAPFEEIATRESSDSGSAAQGGDLGERKKSEYVAQFSDAAMALPLNTVSDPVLTPFGYHLIKVESRKSDSFKARHILVPIEITGDHRDQLDAIADSLETLAAEKPDRAALDTAASALRLTVHNVGPVIEGSRVIVPTQGVVPDASSWAFMAKEGEQSSVIEAPNAFFLFRLDSLHKEGLPSFAEVKADAEARVRLAKKTTEARRLAEQLAKQVAGGATLAAAAKTMGFEHREVGPFARLSAPLGSPVLIGAAFGLAAGELSPPIDAGAGGVETSDQGVYLLLSLEHTQADSAAFAKDLASIRQQAIQAARRTRVNAYMMALRESASVVDKRADVYKTAAQNAALASRAGVPINQ
jgi:peptidyl-prolyl cis-trans isomerase D